MHIALVYDCFHPSTTGGGERKYRAYAERFAAQGHTVTYLTRTQWADEPPPVPAGIEVVAVAGRARLYDGSGGRRLAPALGFAFAVLAHLLRRRGRYDAVLVSALPTLNVLAVRAALLGRRIPVCADYLEVWRAEQWLEYSGPVVGRVARLLQWIAVRLSPLASCDSRMNGRRLVDEGLAGEPIVSPGLIHDGIVPRAVTPAAHPPTVVYAGRMIPDKQVEALPAAIAWARQHVPGLRGRLIGDGETRSRVLAEVARLGLDDVVEVPGFVSSAELAQAMSDAACLVHPSRREGYGIVVVEACSSGTPVVLVEAPDNAALELVEPGVNGAVAASTEPAVLGAAIVEVVHGGTELRRSTRGWFDEALRTRTTAATADAILTALQDRRRADAPAP